MGTKMKKIWAVSLLSVSLGLLGGAPAYAQSCVDFITKMKTAAPGVEDKAAQKGVEVAIVEAEGLLKQFQYVTCVDTAKKALLAAEKK